MDDERQVTVLSTSYALRVEQKSESIWVAVGAHMGQALAVEGGSADAAIKLWQNAVRFRGNDAQS